MQASAAFVGQNSLRGIPQGLSELEKICQVFSQKDFLFLPAERVRKVLLEVDPDPLADWVQFRDSWNDLPLDGYMADGGRYRRRRHATLSALPSGRGFLREPHQPHFQSLTYNSLNGGVARHYEPINEALFQRGSLPSLVRLGCELFGRIAPYYPWHIEVHQFRIEVSEGQAGKPTPEGIHRDGVNFVLMAMVRRQNVVNGSTTIYDLDKLRLDDFTLQQPLDLAIVNDERVFHGVTPIVQLDVTKPAWRDVLVVTYKRKR